VKVPTPNWPTWITTLIFFFALVGLNTTHKMIPNDIVWEWIHGLAVAILAYNHQIAANSVPTGSPDSKTEV
jgi:hypothetical protein